MQTLIIPHYNRPNSRFETGTLKAALLCRKYGLLEHETEETGKKDLRVINLPEHKDFKEQVQKILEVFFANQTIPMLTYKDHEPDIDLDRIQTFQELSRNAKWACTIQASMLNETPIIIHIPHAGKDIPDHTGYTDTQLLAQDMQKLTDHHTDEIFHVPGNEQLIVPWNRCFCDVERFEDAEEELYKKGRGYFYTHTDDGKLLRTEEIKPQVYRDYYLKHHAKFDAWVEKKLILFDWVLIIDGHAFNPQPLHTDLDQSTDRPDICIGTCEYHTPPSLTERISKAFSEKGYSVKINSPYAGTITPLKYYKKDKRVQSIMIEINKRIYMEAQKPNHTAIARLNTIIQNIVKTEINRMNAE